MKKRLFSLCLAFALLASILVSCSGDPASETPPADGDTSAAEQSSEPKEIGLGISSGPHSDDLINYLPAFEEETGITVNVESVAESGYLQKLLLSLSGTEATYDVFMSSNSMWGQIMDPGWAEPLNSFIDDPEKTDPEWRDGISDAMLDIVSKDGERYAVTYQLGTNILYYNKQMLEDAGWDPADPPNTLEEVLEAAEMVNDPANEKYGISFRATREQNQNTFLWVMLWFSQGGDWYNVPDSEDLLVLDRPEAVQATEYFAQFHEFAPEGINNYGFEDAMLAFQQGKTAMWIDTAILANNVLDPELSAVVDDVGFLTLDEGRTIGAPWVFMMASNSQDKDSAWQLMQYLTGFDVTWGQVSSGIQVAPAREDVLLHEDIGEHINAELAQALNDGLETAVPIYFPILASTAELRAELAIAISDVAAGNITAEDAMASTNEAYKEILIREGTITE